MQMWNVIVMGFAFMFMFTAFQTTSIIEASNESVEGLYMNGVVTLRLRQFAMSSDVLKRSDVPSLYFQCFNVGRDVFYVIWETSL